MWDDERKIYSQLDLGPQEIKEKEHIQETKRHKVDETAEATIHGYMNQEQQTFQFLRKQQFQQLQAQKWPQTLNLQNIEQKNVSKGVQNASELQKLIKTELVNNMNIHLKRHGSLSAKSEKVLKQRKLQIPKLFKLSAKTKQSKTTTPKAYLELHPNLSGNEPDFKTEHEYKRLRSPLPIIIPGQEPLEFHRDSIQRSIQNSNRTSTSSALQLRFDNAHKSEETFDNDSNLHSIQSNHFFNKRLFSLTDYKNQSMLDSSIRAGDGSCHGEGFSEIFGEEPQFFTQNNYSQACLQQHMMSKIGDDNTIVPECMFSDGSTIASNIEPMTNAATISLLGYLNNTRPTSAEVVNLEDGNYIEEHERLETISKPQTVTGIPSDKGSGSLFPESSFAFTFS